MTKTALFANNAQSTLAGNITNVATTANLASGTGVLFPSPGAGQYFMLTFVDALTGNVNEIVQVTAMAGDTIVTMVRGQDGTSARPWLAGDTASQFVTAGDLTNFLQTGDVRNQLTGALNVYVSTTGNDANNGLSSGTAWLTLQHAYNVLANVYDLAGFSATINLAHGTYTAGMNVGVALLGGSVTVLGDVGAPSAVIVNVTNNNCFTAFNGGSATVSGMTLLATGSGINGFAIDSKQGGTLNVGAAVIFGACDNGHTNTQFGGVISFLNNYTITGGSQSHLHAQDGGTLFQVTGLTVTLTGTPAFSVGFLTASSLGDIRAAGITYSGGATGPLYNVTMNAVINTGGGTLPTGLSGFTANTGGQFA